MDDKERLRTAKAIMMTSYITNGRTILVEETKETSFLDFLVDSIVAFLPRMFMVKLRQAESMRIASEEELQERWN